MRLQITILCTFVIALLPGCSRPQGLPSETPFAHPALPPPTEPEARQYLQISYNDLIDQLGSPSNNVGDDLVREVYYTAEECTLYFLLSNDDGAGLRVIQAVAQAPGGDENFPFHECLRIISPSS